MLTAFCQYKLRENKLTEWAKRKPCCCSSSMSVRQSTLADTLLFP